MAQTTVRLSDARSVPASEQFELAFQVGEEQLLVGVLDRRITSVVRSDGTTEDFAALPLALKEPLLDAVRGFFSEYAASHVQREHRDAELKALMRMKPLVRTTRVDM